MQQHHDEHIDCADCGAPFVFSADEAAVFVERGLAAPKRCKDCRRARKERAAHDGARSGQPPVQRGASRWGAPAAGAYAGGRAHGNGQGGAGRWNGRDARPPRYTGDVNEYRSPMQDGFSAAPYAPSPRAAPRFNGVPVQGEYRSPMSGGFTPRPPANANHRGPLPGRPAPGRPATDGDPRRGGPRTPRAASGGAQGGHDAAKPPSHEGGSAGKAPRRRPQAEMFSITCDACGVQAEVPFKPAEGREVYCPDCYRARRPSA